MPSCRALGASNGLMWMKYGIEIHTYVSYSPIQVQIPTLIILGLSSPCLFPECCLRPVLHFGDDGEPKGRSVLPPQ